MTAGMGRYTEWSLSISLSVFVGTTSCIGAVDIKQEGELCQAFGGKSESTVFVINDPPENFLDVIPGPIPVCYFLD